MAQHTSVLSEEVLGWLRPSPGKVYFDGTVGLGGHAQKILSLSNPNGRLVAVDKDQEAISQARSVLSCYGERVMFAHDDFRNVQTILDEKGIELVDGALVDLGVSSMQLDQADRGFSFNSQGPLDMRMDQENPLSAARLLMESSEKDLSDILWKYGEERFSRRIASRIVEYRRHKKIERTDELASIVSQSVPAGYRHGRIHPATRTFQAIRIVVNQELESLEFFLDSVTNKLSDGARLAVISFHSLEDRIVKNKFKSLSVDGQGKILTKKPVIASSQEIAANPRSRSAKLRVFEKKKGDLK